MKVLVVDDSSTMRRAIAAMLADAGWRVDEAHSGREALGTLGPGSHDVVVLDIVMPEMDGFETMRAMRAVSPALRIVAVTSRLPSVGPSGSVDYLKLATGLGAHATLRKPFTRAELLDAIAGAARPG
jgi:CheY-like chemotaxis protein